MSHIVAYCPIGSNPVDAAFTPNELLSRKNSAFSLSAPNLQKLDLDLLNQRQTITVKVNDAINAINTTYERFIAAESEVQLARQLEVGERARFNLGDSTLFLVNQRERATAEAETKLMEIRAEYEQAVATFRAATGSFR